MPVCSHCGQRVPAEAANCPACGARVEPQHSLGMPLEAQELAREGRTIEAIKAYREATGASLKEAIEAVDNWLEGHGPPARSIDNELPPEAQQLARDGKKIAAIKAYREATGASLKDAKDAVEDWMRQEGIIAPRGSGCAASVLLACLIVAAGLFSVC